MSMELKKTTNKKNGELKFGIILSYALIAINIVSGFLLVPLLHLVLGNPIMVYIPLQIH